MLLHVQRPWLKLYEPLQGNLLAHSIFLCETASEDATDLPLPYELWVAVALHLTPQGKKDQRGDFRAVCRMASVCRGMRALGRAPAVWEAFCHAVFAAPGFLWSEELLRLYKFSWRTMYRERRRLRFDGIYFFKYTRVLIGLNEGRGMKEADKDFLKPGGHWVITYRVIQFYPEGEMVTFLCSALNPADFANAKTPKQRALLRQRLKTPNFGTYTVHEDLETTTVKAVTALSNPAYPNMLPSTVTYDFELLRNDAPALTSRVGASADHVGDSRKNSACNCVLFLNRHTLTSSDGTEGNLEVRNNEAAARFLPFHSKIDPRKL